MIESNYEVEVKRVGPLTSTVWEIGCCPIRPFSFRAGQYVMVRFPAEKGGVPEQGSPMFALALASAPHDAMLEFCIRLQEGSAMASYVRGLEVGSMLHLQGPHGHFVYNNPERRELVMIGTGTGIAPLRSMLRSQEFLEHRPARVSVLLGVRHEDEILYADEWADCVERWGASSFAWIPVVSQGTAGWLGERGRVTEFLQSWPEQKLPVDAEYYVCGQRDMLQTVSKLLQQRGISTAAIHLSQ